MANVQITQLPQAQPLVGTEAVPIVQNGQTVQTTVGAITSSPALTAQFLLVNYNPSVPNSRYLSAGSGLTLVDGGALSSYSINLTGAVNTLNALSTGLVVKTSSTTLTNRQLAVGTVGLSLTNADGISGNPTFSLTGLPLSLAQTSGSGILTIQSGTTINPVTITGTSGQITVTNGNGLAGNPTISLPNTAVTAGSYTYSSITVDATGRITAASSGSLPSSVTTFSAGTTGLTPATATSGSITLGGTLNVVNGGTGVTTLTGYVKGNGTSPLTTVSVIPTTDLSGTISNAQLTNNSITINGTPVALGGSITVAGTGSVTSVAALTLGTTGTDLSSTVANSTTTPVITLNVPTASATNRGALSAADWTTFNSKAPATTGTSSQLLANNGTGGFSNVTVGSGLTLAAGTLTATGGGTGTVTSVSGTGTVNGITLTGTVTTSGSLTLGGTLSGIGNSQLTNSSITINGTAISLGGTVTTGTVTTLSVVSANGLAGTVATATTTPAITLSTTVTGIVKGNGTALSAATAATDYVAPSSYASTNGLTMATARILGRTTAGTGAAEEITIGSGLTLSAGTLTATGGGSGTVTSVSVTSANGFAGTVATATTTPAITLSTTITGVIKGNGTAISAATAATDYVAPSAYASTNGLTMATARLLGRTTAGTGAAEEITVGSGLSLSAGTLTATGGGSGTVTSVSVVSANGFAGTVATATTTPAITLTTSITGLLKGNGTAISAAVASTDYAPATTGTSAQLLANNGTGGFSNVTVGSGLSLSAGTLTATGGGGTPAGANTQVQYNNSGSFGASSTFTFNGTTLKAPNVETTGGVLADGTFGGTYVDGIVVDYDSVGAAGRISVGGSDGIKFYNGGVGGTLLGEALNNGNWDFNGNIVVGTGTVLGGATNPIISANASANNYIQGYIHNTNSGISASADFVAYADNSTDAHGWADMGYTSSTYADTTYTVTGPNEAYLFGSALNSSFTGNLVYATDSTGSSNAHQWYVGGFTQAKSAWAMQLSSTALASSLPITTTASTTGSSTQGVFYVGTLSYSDVNHLATFQSSVNSYSQVEIQNTNSGNAASADMIVANNLTTSTTYYGDFGMNSSGWTGTLGTSSLSAPNAVYLSATTGDLVLGTTTANGIHFVVNGGADAMAISSSGVVSLASALPISSGGTGQTTQTTAFDALSPNTTKGDIIVYNGTDNVRLPVGSNTYVLTADSTAATGVAWAPAGGTGGGTALGLVTATALGFNLQ